jgi:2,3-bisphosphoglycerate-independent phosphoglycerate mutase
MTLTGLKDPGISSLAATCLTLLGFEPPEDYTPSIVVIN